MKLLATCLLMLAPLALSAHARAADDVTTQEEAAFKAAVAAIAPSVVRVETFGGSEKVGGVLVGSGPTTGLVVSEDGYLLSSAFNFVQKPSSILVTLPSGKRAAASIVARDHSRMLVLLKVQTEEKLPVPVAVPRDEMQVGQWAIAVGRTYDQAQPNLSVGVLSATNRVWSKAIQADAKISPSNYGGPIIDLEGRVLGILVPLSPQDQGEVAGAEWYDSGIGFAVPLVDVLPRLDGLKSGVDLHPGLIGISVKNGDANADPAIIAGCHPKGPADKAGLKSQDKVVSIDGQAIERQNQLKHALGSKYAGDRVSVVVLRGEERIERELQLVEKLEPYQHPLVGILPMRDKGETQGVGVRYVLPGGPAAEAGIEANDRITGLGETEIKDAAALADALAAHEPGATVKLQFMRGTEEKSAQLTLAPLVATIPEALPAAHGKLAEAPQRANVGVIEIKIPEEKSECIAYVPDSYHPDAPHAVLVALHTPGTFDRDNLVARYKALCDKHEVILLLPRSAEATRWDSGDAAFIKKALDDLAAHYQIDRGRIAILGYQSAGTMAWMTALTQADTFRAVAAVESPLPARVKPPEGEPARRTWFYVASSAKSPQKDAIAAAVKQLEQRKHPLVKKDTGAVVRDLNDEELDELGRWLDSLDRL